MTATTSKKKTVSNKYKKRLVGTSKVEAKNKPLSTLTQEALSNYFATLNGHKPGDLYQLVMSEVEKPLFKAVLNYTKGNQSEAAEILGINRGTLRRKLKTYNLRGG